ncbi:MAG: FliM/FliN family flagellar motor switch protein [SAR324 cluster bacterium]|jgi:flagellar motor switch protein FliN/FliY|nr:hypothetical protein [Deltaproteobacteria bacterium]MAD99441.1 hypothetical protein [Pseudomonadota bacterium]MDP6090813.1 FliM/FliN family flagellar motor switch protein [SAR324 cluster bacterium]MDP6245429.1 FliM/FliN family flagellar motor switch protein [SAR324 cluster bacterium]MDP6331154.1 FliM/FliN family flagellar motor switch protein [SAR324 cluster bacterium]|tara:strand:- start:6625 stop:6948 length:324 start_codon:yes stop_codon:yes gene_type:complete
MAGKNISEAELINQETGGKFKALPEMTLTTRLILGECHMEIAEILKLGQGSVLELDSIADQPLELWVNDQFIAKVLPVISHDKVGAQIQEIASKEQRMREITLQSDE